MSSLWNSYVCPIAEAPEGHVYVYICVRVHMYAYVYVHVYVYVFVHVIIYVHVNPHVYVRLQLLPLFQIIPSKGQSNTRLRKATSETTKR